MATETNTPHDKHPLPDTTKEQVLGTLNASCRGRLDPAQLDLIWTMIESATWAYRRSIEAGMTVEQVLDATYRLRDQLAKQFGLSTIEFESVAFAAMSQCACAGFFGVYLDGWIIEV